MIFNIPLSYKLNINDLLIDYNINFNDNIIIINNFKLYINKNKVIYKISSDIELDFLLDFLVNYDNIVIKKIYYFLIMKLLIQKNKKINKEYYFLNCCKDDWFDIYLKTREYHICYNNHIIITEYLNFNICIIINNKTINKSMIAIIDNNCIIDCLYNIIDINIYNSNRFDDIEIMIIGGKIDNMYIIIYIYNILKTLKLSKYINKSYILKNKELKRLKYNTYNNKISFINDNSYCECFGNDNSNHLNNPNFYSGLTNNKN